MTQGFHVDVDELNRTAEKVMQTLEGAEKNDLGSIAENLQKYGNEKISKAISDFFEGTRTAIPAMASNSRSIGMALARSADHYKALDAHVADLMDPGTGNS